MSCIAVSIMTSIELYSSIFLDTNDTQWSARPTAALMRHIYRGNDGSSRWVAIIRNRGEEKRIAIGGPVESQAGTGTALFLPSWFLESISLQGNGDHAELTYTTTRQDVFDRHPITVTFEQSEVIPRATRLVFRAMGDIPEWLDIREILEEPLSQLGVLHQGQMIPVPAFEQIQLLLEVCEPEGAYVFLDGEAALEVLPENECVAPSASASASASSSSEERVEKEKDDDFSSMMPSSSASSSASSSFIPFQGTGHSLQ